MSRLSSVESRVPIYQRSVTVCSQLEQYWDVFPSFVGLLRNVNFMTVLMHCCLSNSIAEVFWTVYTAELWVSDRMDSAQKCFNSETKSPYSLWCSRSFSSEHGARYGPLPSPPASMPFWSCSVFPKSRPARRDRCFGPLRTLLRVGCP